MASVLVVDDDDDIGESLAEILRASGHEVRTARNGKEGLARVAERLPSLVILDVEMPVLTGPDMASLMFVRDCGEEQIPIVLASGIVGLHRLADIVGTPYFLAKPYLLPDLLSLVDRALVERTAPTPRRRP